MHSTGIVVVGAGMGGMAAAARLATAGHRVTVVDRADTHGGALGRYQRDGFGFDTGPGQLYFPAVWRDLFLKTGRAPLEECVELRRVDPAVEHRFADGSTARLPGFSVAGVGQALDEALGAGTGERWRGLLRRGRATWEATRRPLLEEPLTDAARERARAEDPYPAEPPRRGLLRRRARGGAGTLSDVARTELDDPRLAALLGSVARDYGLDPATAPASAAILPYLEQTFGSWYPGGGLRALSDALYERCRERGVRFRFGTGAARILGGGSARGVALRDGEEIASRHVVWAASWPATDAPTAGGAEPGGAGPRPTGRFSLLLALRGERPAAAAHRTVVHPPEGAGPPVTVFRPDDPLLRPDRHHHTAVLTTPAAAQGSVDWNEPGRAERFAAALLETAENAGLGLRQAVLWQHIRTPATVERETGAPGGVVPAPALAGGSGAFLRPANPGRLPGTYRAGGFAHPGGGLVHAAMSGALVAGLIVEGPDWQGSS